VDLNLTPQETQFRDEVREWMAANVPKDWVKRRNAEESMEARFKYQREWQRRMFDAGWVGISWPKEYGGRGASLMETVIFNEEMARAEAPPPANVRSEMTRRRSAISKRF
jgi:alkylation response protein AidB-like acyl-CoA dehydrogenase